MHKPLAIGELGTVLGVWAHPDDEAYLSAGLMAAARDRGHRVAVATATYGERGTPDPRRWPPGRLAAVRRHELVASLAAVDVAEHYWLGFLDGACAQIPEAAGVAAVSRLIDEVRPRTIVTFGPDGMTGHPDHRAVSAWTTAAWRATGTRARLLYATCTPAFHATWGPVNERLGIWMSGHGPVTAAEDLALLVRLDDEALDRKQVALRAHATQTTPLIDELGEDAFRDWWATEAFAAAAPARLSSAAFAGGAR
ncbi:PIG-L deacetylase family protein [Phytohabitans rumicis]|uniref:Mycothiol S-conjugate amidase n=1 Tax=Phytohabitans rumicis TaxID=1076125 RepID=A0A6V8LM37_9ACTN|nr:PIG-L deacetylase family protein [Phytohabitans rumicis]GFJ95236.1 mycothiol S-conjugate amidase [Phytohabitans rumicis]